MVVLGDWLNFFFTTSNLISHLYKIHSLSKTHTEEGCCKSSLRNLSKNVNYKKKIAFADDLLDDTSSVSSSHSGTYSNLNYLSGDEKETNTIPAIGDKPPTNTKSHKSTRFCPEENRKARQSTAVKYNEQCKAFQSSTTSKDKRVVMDSLRLMRNRSLVDIRSQLLHRSLVEEVYKRQLFNTIGAVENIGFQAPCEVSKPVGGAPNCKRTLKNKKGRQGQPSRRL